jgi:glycolate oxidase FAD binding subunit
MAPTELSEGGSARAEHSDKVAPEKWGAAIRSACEDVRDAGDGDSVDGVAPTLVARPSSTDQVSEVLRAAAAHGLTVVPRGRGTKMTWGLPPTSADLVLDVSALDRVLDHAAGDLIVSTQAGARLCDVQETLARGGQQLAVDETVGGESIGGAVAANTSGPRRFVAGTLRDLLIGITVVRADGVVAKAGGRVVKNVAGYDIGKLMIGSFGTLAVVTEAVFRLHPLPDVRAWVTVRVDDPGRAHELVHAVVHAQAVPTAVEVDWPATGGGSVSVLLEGKADGVAGRARTVAGLLGAGADAAEQDQPAGWGAYPWSAGETACKLTFVLSGLADVLAAAREVGADLRGSGGTGVVYAAVADPDRVPAAVERLRALCARHQGSLVVLDGPAAVKRSVDVWGPVPAIDLMRRVKDRFDPDHRLSPGRFVGGI